MSGIFRARGKSGIKAKDGEEAQMLHKTERPAQAFAA
jgi:hypothetical protein